MTTPHLAGAVGTVFILQSLPNLCEVCEGDTEMRLTPVGVPVTFVVPCPHCQGIAPPAA
jgi:hypothetical protein